MRVLLHGLLITFALAAPAGAQVDDDQTSDHEHQDQRYLERLRQLEEQQVGDDADDRSAEDEREAFLAAAERLVRDRHYDARLTAHYRVQTDDIRLLVEETGELFESFHAFFERFWEGRLELAPAPEEVSRVFLFRSFYKYNQLLRGDFRRIQIRPKGHYLRAFDVVVAHTGADMPEQLPDALVHEATHQLVEQRIYAGTVPSLWVSEGLASYFGYMYRAKDGVFHPEIVGGKSIRLIRDIPPGQSREGVGRLRSFKRAARELSRGDLVDRLVRMRDPAEFYGEDVELYYSASWLLVHYLLVGEDGGRAEAFARYLSLDGQGGGAEALYRVLQVGPDELQAGFFAHVSRIRTR